MYLLVPNNLFYCYNLGNEMDFAIGWVSTWQINVQRLGSAELASSKIALWC